MVRRGGAGVALAALLLLGPIVMGGVGAPSPPATLPTRGAALLSSSSAGHPGPAPPTAEGAALAQGPRAASPTSPGVARGPLSESTLVLTNNTLLPGNYLPQNGAAPVAATVDPTDGKVFVAGYWSNSVVELSRTTHQVVGYLQGFVHPTDLSYDPVDGDLYVVSAWNSTYYLLSSVQASTGVVLASVLVQGGYEYLAVDPWHGHVFVMSASPIPVYQVLMFSTTGLAQVGAIGLSGSPWLLTMGPRDQTLYVVNAPQDLTLINASTGAIGPSYPLSISPLRMVADPVDDELYLVGWGGTSEEMDVVSLTSDAEVDLFPVTQLAWGMTVDANSGNVFVGTINGSGLLPSGDGNVSVYAPTQHTLLATVTVGMSPWGLADDPSGTVVVTDERSDDVTFLNATTFALLGRAPVGPDPGAVVVDPTSGDVYVALDGTDQVAVLSSVTGRVLTNLSVGGAPRGLCFDPVTNEVFVSDQATSNVSVIDATTETVVASVPVGPSPYGLAYDPVDDLVWVAESASGEVGAIDPATDRLVQNVSVGVLPQALVFDPYRNSLDVASPLTDSVLFLTGPGHATVRSDPTEGTAPWALALDGTRGRLFIANLYSGNLTVLSASTGAFLGSAALYPGAEASAVDYDATWDAVSVANPVGDNVTVLTGSGLRSLGTFPVGGHPEGLADRNGVGTPGRLFVADYGSSSVTSLDLPYSAQLSIGVSPGGFGCNSYLIDGTTVWNGSSVTLTLGNHTLFAPQFCSGARPFASWTYGGQMVLNGASWTTTFQLLGDADLNATYGTVISRVNVTVHVSPSTCPPILWGLSSQPDGSNFLAYTGTTSIRALSCANRTFEAWNTSGALTVASPTQALTNANLAATALNGSLTAWYVWNVSVPPPLTVALQYSPTTGTAPLSVTFLSTPSGGSPPYAISWNFGDGTTSPLQDPVHTFTGAGTYSVTLNVRDTAGDSVTRGFQVSVLGASPLVATAEAQPTTVTLGQSVRFLAFASGGAPPYAFDWTSLPPGCTIEYVSGFTCTPSAAGVYQVRLVVVDAQGNVAGSTVQVSVTSPSPPTATPAPWGEGIGGAMLIALLLAIVAWVVLLRRGHEGPRRGAGSRSPVWPGGTVDRSWREGPSSPDEGPPPPPPAPPRGFG